MKARIKETGEILEVQAISDYINKYGQLIVEYKDDDGIIYTSFELDFDLEENIRIPYYWARLEHQAAIAAMGGMCGNTKYNDYAWVDMAEDAIRAAHALVEMMKEERK